MVGAYYFDGWGGRNSLADDPSQPWAKDAPTHLTQRMVDEFPDREPVWGWRADSGPNSRDGDRDGFAAMQETARQAGLPGLAIAGCGGEVLDAVAWMDQNPEKTTAERIVLVYAWNEFGEGGHIAPTKGDPEGEFLKALKAVVESEV
jgi:hypothetical protein